VLVTAVDTPRWMDTSPWLQVCACCSLLVVGKGVKNPL